MPLHITKCTSTSQHSKAVEKLGKEEKKWGIEVLVMVMDSRIFKHHSSLVLTSAAVSSLVSSLGRPLDRFFCTPSSSS